jgi:hypothetical protein
MHFDSFSLGVRHLFQKLVLFFYSFSLGVRHLFQKLVLFFYVKLYLWYIVVFRIKISTRITTKKYVFPFKKNILTV